MENEKIVKVLLLASQEIVVSQIEEVAAVNGIDGEDLCRRAQEVHIKNQLKENTSDALNVGACGVPTFVWNGQVWWGQDRILSLIQRIVTTD